MESQNKDEPALASQHKPTPSSAQSSLSQDTENQHSNLSMGPHKLISAKINNSEKTSTTPASQLKRPLTTDIAPHQHFVTPVNQSPRP